MGWFFKKKNKNRDILKGSTDKKESRIKETTSAASFAIGDYVEPQYEDLSYSQIETLYERSNLLKKYVKVITDEIMRYKLKAVPKKEFKDDKKSIEKAAEINSLFTVSNDKLETFNEIREQYWKDLLLYGRGGIEIQPSNKDEVKALYAVPGYAIRLNVDQTGGNFKNKNRAYSLVDPNDTSKVVATLPYDSLVYYVFDKISDRVYGDCPLDSIRTELVTDIKASKNVETGVNNLKSGVLCVPKAPKKLLRDVITKLTKLVRGNARAKVVAINSEGKFVDMTNMTPEDNMKVQEWLIKKANIYNIPLFKLGFDQNAGSLNAREQKDDFRALIAGMVQYEIDKLNAVLIITKLKYNDIEIICPDFADKLAYERTRIAVRLVNGKIITPNEARERYLGLPKLDDPIADQLQIAESQSVEKTIVKEEVKPEPPQEPRDKSDDVVDETLRVQQLEINERKKKLLDHLLKKDKENKEDVEEVKNEDI